MTALSSYLKSRATGRAVAGLVIFALLAVLVQYAVLIPNFQAATTFKPFDVQVPLTRYMIAIQLGAYHPTAAPAYLPFVLVDTLLSFVSAAALMLLWSWLFRTQPTRVFAFLERGFVVLVPVYTLICNVIENIAFARLIGGVSGEAYARTVEFAVTIHSVHNAFLDLQMILTIVFVILFALAAGTKARSATLREETAANGQ